MMGTQLIICVETNQKCKSDFIYIKDAIEQFYLLDNASVKLSPVYMDGKGNYCSTKTLKKIAKYSRDYSVTSKNAKNVVLCCVDCDEYDSKPEDVTFLQNVKKFCEESGYHFVWFCKNIEMVFLGMSISDSEKYREARLFKSKRKIVQVDIQKMRAKDYRNKHSNLCSVLDEYLIEKTVDV